MGALMTPRRLPCPECWQEESKQQNLKMRKMGPLEFEQVRKFQMKQRKLLAGKQFCQWMMKVLM